MPKSLRKQDEEAISDLLNLCIDHLVDLRATSGKVYTDLVACQSAFEPGSNTVETINSCRTCLTSFDVTYRTDVAGQLEHLIVAGVRATNYPTTWRKEHTDLVAAYLAAHPGPNIAPAGMPVIPTWMCPTAGGKGTPHAVLHNTATIEHIRPVVWHWNNHGRNQTRGDRKDWYFDKTNHEVICQSCNSAKSGSGATYQIATGQNYSN